MSIKAMRERAGLSQMELAERLGIDQTSIVGWERGKWYPKTSRLKEIATLLNCSLDELLAADEQEDGT